MTQHTLGDAPIDPHLVEIMNSIAKLLDRALNGDDKPKLNGFCLMIFPFDDFDGRANYISNARREDIIVLLKEQLARFEGQPEIRGNA